VTGRLALTKKFQQDSILDQMFGKAKMYKLDMKTVEEYQFKQPDDFQAKETFSWLLFP
jgi:hypothetical protein